MFIIIMQNLLQHQGYQDSFSSKRLR